MRYRILHIPSGDSFLVVGAHAKSLERFKEEFKVSLYYIQTPINDKCTSVSILKNRIRKQLKRINLNYSDAYVNAPYFWMGHFAFFVANHSLDVSDRDMIALLKTEWANVITEEYEAIDA